MATAIHHHHHGVGPHPSAPSSSSAQAAAAKTQQSSSQAAAAMQVPSILEERESDGRISRRYVRGKLLGKGGFARCFELTDMASNEILAGKIMQKSSLIKAKAKAKLQTEIKIHSSLKHKNIVGFHRYFEDSENVYIILELCKNQTLMELMKRRKRVTEPEAQYFMLQTLSAVKFMHTSACIHRDLKLGNLFLGDGLEIKIGDFGLATTVEFEGERKRTICGTPNYIAPELLDGKNGHSFEADIWSLGVILFALLFGKPPFETEDVKTTYQRIRSNTFSFPPGVEVSDSAKNLIRRILQTRPESRPTLDDIIRDPWLMDAQVPRHLPQVALTGPPPPGSFSIVHASYHLGEQAPPIYRAVSSARSAPQSASASSGAPASGVLAPSNAANVIMAKTSELLSKYGGAPARPAPVNPQQQHHQSHASSVASAAISAIPSYRRPVADSMDKENGAAGAASSMPGMRRSARPESAHGHHAPSAYYSQQQQQQPPSAPSSSSSIPRYSETLSSARPMSVDVASRRTHAAVTATKSPVSAVQQQQQQHQQQSAPSSSLSRPSSAIPSSSSSSSALASSRSLSQPRPQSSSASSAPQPQPQPQQAMSVQPSKPAVSHHDIDDRDDGDDMGNLTNMHHNLTVLCEDKKPLSPSSAAAAAAGVSRSSAARAVDPSMGPGVWVTKWADYSSKYGLAWRLNNGTTGVHFNDSTKIVLHHATSIFEYIERNKSENSASGSRDEVASYSLSSHPADKLHKKVTLLNIFKNHLDKHSGTTPSAADASNGAPVASASAALAASESSAPCSPSGMVYVKRWLQTRHAIIFRLSNKSVQVCFFDSTEIILSSEAKLVTYTDARGERSTFLLSQVVSRPPPEVAKRLKYTKEILYQLINKKAANGAAGGSPSA